MEKSQVEFGELAGSLTLHQLKCSEFYDRCKSVNSQEHDFTGQRVYSGTHVMVEFLYRNPWFLKGRRVVELGCGVGACGILCGRMASRVVMTDGEASTVDIARTNVRLAVEGGQLSEQQSAMVHPLSWGDAGAVTALLSLCQLPGGFDVVIGVDLMYYSVDMEALLSTAVALMAKDAAGRPSGVILLAHIFRTAFLASDLVRMCREKHGLAVYDVPLAGLQTLCGAHTWQNMRLLCCVAAGSAMEAAARENLPPATRGFDGTEAEEEREAEGQGPAWSLSSMFQG